MAKDLCYEVKDLIKLDGLKDKINNDGEKARITYDYIKDFLEAKKSEVLNMFFTMKTGNIEKLNELRIAGQIILELIGNLEMIRDADELDKGLRTLNKHRGEGYDE